MTIEEVELSLLDDDLMHASTLFAHAVAPRSLYVHLVHRPSQLLAPDN